MERKPVKAHRPFNPRALPPALQEQLSEKWVAQELNSKGLLASSKLSHLEDGRRSRGFLEALGVVALAGLGIFSMGKLGYGQTEALAVGFLVALFGLVSVALGRGGEAGDGKKFWLHNFGTMTTGAMVADAMVAYGTSGIGIDARGIAVMYAFEDKQGVKHLGGEPLGKAYLPYKDALKGGLEVQVLYHPDHPEMNTICLPLSMEEYCLRNDVGM